MTGENAPGKTTDATALGCGAAYPAVVGTHESPMTGRSVSMLCLAVLALLLLVLLKRRRALLARWQPAAVDGDGALPSLGRC